MSDKAFSHKAVVICWFLFSNSDYTLCLIRELGEESGLNQTLASYSQSTKTRFLTHRELSLLEAVLLL